MTAYLTVGPMPERLHRNQVIVLAEPEAFLHLPAVETGLHDIRGGPVHVVGDDNVLAEPRAVPY